MDLMGKSSDIGHKYGYILFVETFGKEGKTGNRIDT